jgi:hypothetical protein
VTVGDTLSEQFTAPGAFGTVTFSTDASKLPRGVTLSTSGLLSGTPKDAGNYDIVVFAKDSAGCSTSVTYKLTVTCQVLAVFPPVVVCSIN